MWVLNKERKNFIQQGNCMVAMGGKYSSTISSINWQYDDRFYDYICLLLKDAWHLNHCLNTKCKENQIQTSLKVQKHDIYIITDIDIFQLQYNIKHIDQSLRR